MTQKEFEQICEILDKNTRLVWVNPYYCKKYIPTENIRPIKDEIQKLVVDKKGDKQNG